MLPGANLDFDVEETNHLSKKKIHFWLKIKRNSNI